LLLRRSSIVIECPIGVCDAIGFYDDDARKHLTFELAEKVSDWEEKWGRI
jgi:hypothetical protein